MTSLLVPKVIGHRGAAAYAPENTLASIHTAADLGIEWVALDVKLTKDGTAIIFHDDTLERTTGAEGLVAETDYAAIQELDAGSWMGDSFIGEKIPTLEEALDAILSRGIGANLNIKPCPGREVETAETMLDVATRIWPEDSPPPLISSFSHVCLERAFEMIPEWHRGLLLEEHLPNWKEIAAYLEVFSIHFDADKVTEDQIEEYITAQKILLAYTVNDQQKAQLLMRFGVDGVFSDCPDVIREAIETQH